MTLTEQDKELRDKIATIVEYWDFSPLQDEDTRIERLKNEIMQLIATYTNKQIEEVLIGFAKEADTEYYRSEIDEWLFSLGLIVHKAIIEAERNRREERK